MKTTGQKILLVICIIVSLLIVIDLLTALMLYRLNSDLFFLTEQNTALSNILKQVTPMTIAYMAWNLIPLFMSRIYSWVVTSQWYAFLKNRYRAVLNMVILADAAFWGYMSLIGIISNVKTIMSPQIDQLWGVVGIIILVGSSVAVIFVMTKLEAKR